MSEAAPACKPNISPAGRWRRTRFGNQWLVVSIVVLVALVVLRVRWYGGLIMFIPVALSAIGFLQARRRTCIMRAAEGTFENEDFSTVAAAADEVAASRKVALGIRRDVALIGLGGAALGVVVTVLFHRI